VPVDVIEHLTGIRNQNELDGKLCMFEMFVLSHSAAPAVLPPVLLRPTSGGEVRVGKRVCPEYPDSITSGQYLLVQITRVD
jgi:hypothetical protein